MIRIDKSIFSPEELEQYEALIAKASVDPEYAEDEMEDDIPDEEYYDDTEKADDMDFEDPALTKKKCKKSASPEMAAALNRLANLEKSIKMKDFREIAKKYEPLGEDPEELAKSLYDMAESNEDNYNAYIAVLDKSLGIVEKSGIFSEIGKSFSGTGGSVTDRIEAAATEIQKSDPTIDRVQAIAKAWDNHPELIAEYEKSYKK